MSLPPENLSTVEGFLENDAFRIWITERRPEDRVYWQEWLIRYPEKREIYEQAVVTLLVLQGKTVNLSDRQVKAISEGILDELPDAFPVIRPLSRWHWGRWVAAAAVVGLLVCGYFNTLVSKRPGVADGSNEQTARTVAWKVVKNRTGQPLVVLLPDNSSVLLSDDSQLRFRKRMNQAVREVYLRGEGFFEVTKNPASPFIIYTSNLTTRVLGTSFQVRSFDQENTAFVKVKTGKVTVTPVRAPDKSVLLTVNQEFRLKARTSHYVRRDIVATESEPSALIRQQFVFNYTPVPEVFDQLAESYHMPIRYDREVLKGCTFTGQLSDAPFLEKVRLICLTIESTFELVDNQVIIRSRGCH
ncbi:FecR family protein [Larkinella knui]|uniref:DUF4974 domain-containing protein n=1 Tax=Larkinella knui TaxID=2025310 RepID=A0A3P1CL54_9BACT|nr:FecR family protein [Larkinella knui]RRB14015.1 DUF4974 domain-containing protein [Larkinella knui]